jgi:hypothetical protein
LSARPNVQASALDRTKGPVGLSGTVLETRVVHPRSSGEPALLEISFQCNGIRCRVTQSHETAAHAKERQRNLPPGAHLTAFGEASNLYLQGGELHLATDRLITYQLTSDFTQKNLFTEVS